MQKFGYTVYVATTEGEEVELFQKIGCIFCRIPIDNRGTNPISDIKLLYNLVRLLKQVKPDLVLTFYTKTNIYAGLACQMVNIPYIENITGLGSALGGKGWKQKMMIQLYGKAVKKADMVFFQNIPNMEFFKKHGMTVRTSALLPGSGVALERHNLQPQAPGDKVKFVYIGRLMLEKGIVEYLEAAHEILRHHSNVEFHIVGPAEPFYLELLQKYHHPAIIFHGKVVDVRPTLASMHCLVFPSYYNEGMANVILEGAATGRPVIATDWPGCREAVDHGESGFIIPPRNVPELVKAMESIISMSPEERKKMGDNGRLKMEKEFDRHIVTDAYMLHIRQILNSGKQKEFYGMGKNG